MAERRIEFDRSPAPDRPGIESKSIRETPDSSDGKRILIDRVWPEGVSREEARLSECRPDWAPSWSLYTWYGFRPDRFEEFVERYRQELFNRGKRAQLAALAAESRERRVTLVHADPDEDGSSATALVRIIRSI